MGQTWNANLAHDAGNVIDDIVGWLSGPPGDPGRIRQCAGQVESLRDRFTANHRALDESIDELTRAWQGDGASAFHATWYGGGGGQAPEAVLTGAAATLDRFARQLYDYADQLQHAQDEHWLQMGIMAALTIVNVVQLGADPATDGAEIGVAAGTAVGTSLALADIGTMAIEGAVIGFSSDVVSQLGADLMDRLNPQFDRTGDHAVGLFDPAEAALSTVMGGASGLVLGGGTAIVGFLRSPAADTLTGITADARPPALDVGSGGGIGGAGELASPGAQSNFMAPGEQFAQNAAHATPLDGYHDVIVHGSPTDFGASPTSWADGSNFDHRALAGLIRHDPEYPGGPVRLMSCQTGCDSGSAAQNLANKLGVEVRAPSDTLWAFPNGKLVIGPTYTNPTGEWRDFVPGVRP